MTITIRANADDGLLCGVLLLPMVAIAKLVDASRRNIDKFHIGKNLVAYLIFKAQAYIIPI
jgi:hypothetical protein